MRRRNLLLGLPPALLWPRGSRCAPPVLVVVVGQNNAVNDVSLAQLRTLFLGTPMTGPKGERLLPLNQPPGTPDRIAFDRLVLGMTPEEAGAYWVDHRIRGGGRPPRSFDPAQLQRLVPRLPGALTYLRAEQVSAGLRVVPVDGKAPGQKGYPLVG